MAGGRPTDYTDEIADLICERIADGESLRNICVDEDMPARSTVFRWLSLNEVFSDQYAKAREAQAETMADELLDIADNGTNDWMERNSPDNPGWVTNGEAIQRSRLRVDTRKWVASKLLPKKYGERQHVEMTGKDGGAIKTEGASDRELAKAVASLLSKGLTVGSGD